MNEIVFQRNLIIYNITALTIHYYAKFVHLNKVKESNNYRSFVSLKKYHFNYKFDFIFAIPESIALTNAIKFRSNSKKNFLRALGIKSYW